MVGLTHMGTQARVHEVHETVVGGRTVRHTPFSAHFDGMSWPTIGKTLVKLDYRFRYGDPASITRSDLLQAASILSAYRALVGKGAKDRASIVAVLRAVDDVPGGDWHPGDEL